MDAFGRWAKLGVPFALAWLAGCGAIAPIGDCSGSDCVRAMAAVLPKRRAVANPCTPRGPEEPPATEQAGSAPSTIQYDGPPIGAIRWDGWTNDPTLPWWTSAGLGKMVPSGSKFRFRKPSLWNDFQLYGRCVDTQTIVDAEIAAAHGKIDFWLFDWYPPRELLDVSDQLVQCDIQLAFDAYESSPRKGDVKFALLLQHGWMVHPDGSGAYFDAYAEWVAKRVRDPQYQRIDGKPLIVLYNDLGRDGGWANDVSRWSSLRAAIGEDVYGVSVNSVAMLENCSLQANMIYGPNGSLVGGTGRRAYREQAARDAARDGSVPGADRISGRTALSDRRAFLSETATSWIDQPTQPEWVSAVESAIAPTQKFAIIYSWNEVSEGGPGIVPTFQEGTRYLDAIGWARGAERPTSYTYPLDFTSLYCTSSGVWTESFPDAPNAIPAHDGDEVLSSTPGAYKEFSHPALGEVHIHATTGPDRGIIDLLVDAGPSRTIDLYSPDTKTSADVATTTFAGPPASHTVRVTVRGDKNPKSTSSQVGLDYAAIGYDPSAVDPLTGSTETRAP